MRVALAVALCIATSGCASSYTPPARPPLSPVPEPARFPQVSDADQSALLHQMMLCLNNAILALDDGQSDAATIADAATIQCHTERETWAKATAGGLAIYLWSEADATNAEMVRKHALVMVLQERVHRPHKH